jgi:hypothetical protein
MTLEELHQVRTRVPAWLQTEVDLARRALRAPPPEGTALEERALAEREARRADKDRRQEVAIRDLDAPEPARRLAAEIELGDSAGVLELAAQAAAALRVAEVHPETARAAEAAVAAVAAVEEEVRDGRAAQVPESLPSATLEQIERARERLRERGIVTREVSTGDVFLVSQVTSGVRGMLSVVSDLDVDTVQIALAIELARERPRPTILDRLGQRLQRLLSEAEGTFRAARRSGDAAAVLDVARGLQRAPEPPAPPAVSSPAPEAPEAQEAPARRVVTLPDGSAEVWEGDRFVERREASPNVAASDTLAEIARLLASLEAHGLRGTLQLSRL